MSKELTVIERQELDAWDNFANAGNLSFMPRRCALMKFSGLTGIWRTKLDPTDLTGTRYLTNPNNVHSGYTKFENKKPVDSRIVRVPSRPVPRNTLPDRDPTKWTERGLDGQIRDPWVLSYYLPLLDPTTGRRFIYIAQSQSGIREIQNVVGAYSLNLHNLKDRNNVPVVVLERESFPTKFGSVCFAPVFEIIDWKLDEEPKQIEPPSPIGPSTAGAAAMPANDTSDFFDVDDELPL